MAFSSPLHSTDAVTFATLTAWIDKFGMTGADRALDTSRSTLQMLWKGPHRWNFFIRSRFGPGNCGIESILMFLKYQYLWIRAPIEIPDDWKSAGDSLLNAALAEYLDNLQESCLQYKPREYFSDIAYPSANITLHEIQDPALKIYDVKWMLFKLLSRWETDGYNNFDEHFPSCDVIRSTPIALPIYCAGFGSSTRPDFACIPSKSKLPNGLPGDFFPIVFAVDYVDSISDLTNEEIRLDQPSAGQNAFPDRSQGIVKLAKMFEPALQLLVTYITKKYQSADGQWKPEWDPLQSDMPHLWPDLPEDLFLYAINYTKSDCMVYAFFPRYSVTASGRVEWGFCCSEAYWLPSLIASRSLRDRLRAFKIFMRVQRQTMHVVDILTDLSRGYGEQ